VLGRKILHGESRRRVRKGERGTSEEPDTKIKGIMKGNTQGWGMNERRGKKKGKKTRRKKKGKTFKSSG